jgi:hypothetical protein
MVVIKGKVVLPDGDKEYPVKKVKEEVTVAKVRASDSLRDGVVLMSIQETPLLPSPSVGRTLLGAPTNNRAMNVLTVTINTLLLLFVLDSTWSAQLFLTQRDLTYAR